MRTEHGQHVSTDPTSTHDGPARATTVLVVDDEKSLRISLREFLRDAGYAVEIAEDATQAMEKVQAMEPDVVVADIVLPQVTGVSLLKSITDTAPQIQVILMTGEPTLETATEAVRASAFDYLSKPVSKELFLKTVGNAAKVKRAEDARRRLEEENRRYQQHLEHLVEERTTKLRQSLEQYRNLVDYSPYGIYQIDRDGLLVTANRAGLQMIGREREADVMQLHFLDTVSEMDRTRVEEFLRLVAEGSPQEFEYQNRNQQWCQAIFVSLHNACDTGGHFMGIALDITERKLAEQRVRRTELQLRHTQKMNTIGTLAGGIAHDFNNILGGILSAGEWLLEKSALRDPTSRELLDGIVNAATRAGELTGKLLAFGRKTQSSKQPLDVHGLLRDAGSILQRTIKKTIRIIMELDAPHTAVLGDHSGLESAVLNIGINACHAMDGEGTLTISTCNRHLTQAECDAYSFQLQPGEFLQVAFRDSGCGIPENQLDKIFEPFYTTKPPGEGSGLGLSAVYGTMQEHGAAVWVDSTVGVGTTFSMLLPCSGWNVEEKAPDTSAYCGSGCVLLVDDDEFMQKVGKLMLEDMGYHVLEASDGRRAITIFEAEHAKIDLVLMDIVMPVMDGYEAISHLRAIDDTCKILVTSGYAGGNVSERLQQANVSGFLRKPYKKDELAKVLAECMN